MTVYDELILGNDFPNNTHTAWLETVAKALHQKSFDTCLSKEIGGLTRQPLYTKSSTELPPASPFTRGTKILDKHRPWHIGTRVTLNRKGHNNTEIHTALKGGVSALLLDFSESSSLPNLTTLDTLLDNINLNIIPLLFHHATHGSNIIPIVIDLCRQYGYMTNQIYFDYDPLGVASTYAEQPIIPDITKLISMISDYPHYRLMTSSSIPYHNAGADIACELGCILATTLAYARHLESAHLSAEEALSQITLTTTTDIDFFASIAKIRALRTLWYHMTTVAHLPNIKPHIHVETSEHNSSIADPWVNILRTTVASFAASLGGSDIITTLPCTSVTNSDNLLTARIARNTQIILQEESHIGRVTDTAGGSWYIEKLTQDLCESGWAWLQKIEDAGGMQQALSKGIITRHIVENRKTHTHNAETLQTSILGANIFSDLNETLLKPRIPYGKGILSEQRPAEIFEKLRYIAQYNKEKLYLTTIKKDALCSQQSDFIIHCFSIGNITAIIHNRDTDIASDFISSQSKIVVICSPQNIESEGLIAQATILRQSGAEYIWLSTPSMTEKKFECIDGYIFHGCNIVKILQDAYHILGLERIK